MSHARPAVLVLVLLSAGCPPPAPEPNVRDDEVSTCAQPGTVVALDDVDGGARIEIDVDGIAHLACSTDAACFAALGYAHATHRFSTMELARRAARGRSASLLGASSASSDALTRALFSTAVGEPLEEALLPTFSAEARALLDAYAMGVNAWLADLRADRNDARISDDLFALAEGGGVSATDLVEGLAPWSALDSTAILVSTLFGVGAVADEAGLAELAGDLPSDLFIDFFAPIPGVASYVEPAAGTFAARTGRTARRPVRDGSALRDARPALREVGMALGALRATLEKTMPQNGSNNWAVSGARTASGGAILGLDPHGGLAQGGVFLVEMDAVSEGRGTFHAAGGTVPGLPLFANGHNGAVGWSCTVSFADVFDLYIEELHVDGDGLTVSFADERVPVRERPFSIEVANSAPVSATLAFVPHHGPVLFQDPASGIAVSARWVAHDGTFDFDAYLDLARARDVDEAATALAQSSAMGCNNVVADSAGRVGHVLMAQIPNRPWASWSRPPWLALPGDGTAEWQGLMPVHATIDPAAGFIASANNALDDAWADGDPTNDGRPYLQGAPVEGSRHARIVEVLAADEAHTMDASVQLQADTLIHSARVIVPALLASGDARDSDLSDGARGVREALRAWAFTCPTGLAGIEVDSPASEDLSARTEAIGCSAYHVSLLAVTFAAFADELDAHGRADAFSYVTMERVLHRLLTAPSTLLVGEALFDDVSTDAVETRDDIMARTLQVAADFLTDRFGPDPADWLWGRLHILALPSASGRVEDRIGPWANDGGVVSVDPGLFALTDEGFVQVHGALQRTVVEFTPSGARALVQAPTGLSLHRDSPFFDNLVEGYLKNEGVPLLFERDEVRDAATSCVGLRER